MESARLETPMALITNSRKRRMRNWLILAGVAYTLIVVIMCFLESKLVFRAVPASERWQEPPDPNIEEVAFPMAGGGTIHGWWLPKPDCSEALLLCHGNYGNVSDRGQSLVRLRQEVGCSALIFDYPGYGKSPGRPTEESCYESAEAALAWLSDTKGIPSERALLYGESLGGGVAVEMARRHPVRALMLVKTFTSLPAVAKRRYPWLPVNTLMRTRFDNLAKIGECHCPIFITSATGDALVPFALGEELFRAAPEPKCFFALEGQDHADRLPDECFAQLRRFLEGARAEPVS
jgi:fermentation-respiration switch protein FrsA (DUF1100 family)